MSNLDKTHKYVKRDLLLDYMTPEELIKSLSEAIEGLERTGIEYSIEYDYGDEYRQYYVYGWRPKTPEELEQEKQAAIKAKEQKKNQKKINEERERKEYERLKKKYK